MKHSAHKTKFFSFLWSFLFFQSLYAQIYMDKGPVGTLKDAEIMIYGPDAAKITVPYTRITGSPFYWDDWKLASLYSEEKRISIVPVRLNLATNEIHFLRNEQELVATPDNKITAILFHKEKDTSAVTEFFFNISGLNEEAPNTNTLLKALNTGNYQLLRQIERKLTFVDSLFGTQKRWIFKDEIHYYLKTNDKMMLIRRLNSDTFIRYIPAIKQNKSWIEQNNINFKKEEDIVHFLNYLNSKASSK